MAVKGSTLPLPEMRLLSEKEIEELRLAKKQIVDDIRWTDASRPPYMDRKWRSSVEVYVVDPSRLSFQVQSTMEMELNLNRGGEQNFWYRLIMTRQIVRMFHNSPGHLESGMRILGQHKHVFDEITGKRGGYPPDPPLSSKLKEAVLDFAKEENIMLEGKYVAPTMGTTLRRFDGG